jgi:hypothetical protein
LSRFAKNEKKRIVKRIEISEGRVVSSEGWIAVHEGLFLKKTTRNNGCKRIEIFGRGESSPSGVRDGGAVREWGNASTRSYAAPRRGR